MANAASKAAGRLVTFVCYLLSISLQKETNHDLEEALSTDQREGLQN